MRTTVFTLSSVAVCLGIVAACTQDFGTFEGTPAEGGTASSTSSGGGSSTSGGGSSTSGGSTSGGSTSGGSTSGTPGVDANVDCQAISGSCYTQATACNTKCNTDGQTCRDACPQGGQGNKCRNDCDTVKAGFLAQCKMTCEQCAGPQCSGLCP